METGRATAPTAGLATSHSAVDGACSFAFARVLAGEKSASTAAAFLERDVAAVYAEAGIKLREVILDGGPEFKREFAATCTRLGITRHQLPARSPNLNAFVERFQGSVLHLHYRTAFRYRFYTRAGDIDADLQAWLRFYNFERPHRGYRTRGRRPAEIFYADCPALLVAKGWDSDDFTPAKCPVVTRAARSRAGRIERRALLEPLRATIRAKEGTPEGVPSSLPGGWEVIPPLLDAGATS